MVRFSIAEARRQLSHLLDIAQQGDVVVLERRGVRFHLTVDAGSDASADRQTAVLIVRDPDVLAGQWTWTSTDDGQLQFQPLPADGDA